MKKRLPTAFLPLFAAALLTVSCREKKVEPAPVPVVENAMTYRVAGLAVTATSMTSTYNSGVLAVIGITTPQSLTVQMNPTTSGTISNGTISYANAGAVWSSSAVDGSSTIELSEFNTATRKASGTFTATLQPFPGTSATGSKTVTDGTFTNVSF